MAGVGKTAELVDDSGRSDEAGYACQVQETQHTGDLREGKEQLVKNKAAK